MKTKDQSSKEPATGCYRRFNLELVRRSGRTRAVFAAENQSIWMAGTKPVPVFVSGGDFKSMETKLLNVKRKSQAKDCRMKLSERNWVSAGDCKRRLEGQKREFLRRWGDCDSHEIEHRRLGTKLTIQVSVPTMTTNVRGDAVRRSMDDGKGVSCSSIES